MKFLEKDLEEVIFDAYQYKFTDNLKKRGLPISGKMKKQVRLGNYGILDLITVERSDDYIYEIDKIIDDEYFYLKYNSKKLIFTIYELKKEKVGVSAFLQSIRYSKGLKSYLNYRKIYNFEIKIVLIGNEIDLSGSLCYIPELFDNVNFYTYKYDLEGIKFKEEYGYELKKEGW